MAAAAGGGALAQLGTQSIGQSIAFGIGRAQQNDSWDAWKRSLKKGPTYVAQGLERAGINRILAAGGGIGATSAGGILKANAAGMGGKGDNPSVAAASARALNAQANLTSTQQEIADAQLIYEQGRAALYSTTTGKGLIEAEAYLKSLPNNITGAAIRGGAKLMDYLRSNADENNAKSMFDLNQNGKPTQDNDGNWRDDGGKVIPTLTIRPKK